MEIMEHVINAVNNIKNKYPEHINAIETGTIRSYNERHESTKHIAITLGNRGVLTSVDIEPKSIEISRDICKRLTNINYVESDSHAYLKSIKDKKFHFALLDSVNDKDFIMEEFKLVLPLMHEDGIIVIDDAGISQVGTQIDKTVDAQKGHAVWKLLFDNQIAFSIVNTILGHGTQLIIQLSKKKIERINKALKGDISDKSKPTMSANIMFLNEEFWIEKQLNHIYNFFDEIVICEGSESKSSSSGFHGWDKEMITKDGLSTDKSAEVIRNFPDPDKKIVYIQKGIVNNKVDLNNEMYKASTSDYVWEVDADEFYPLETMENIRNYLTLNKDVNQINFRMYHFIDFENCIHGIGGERWGDDIDICRIFKREERNYFTTHRPPTVKYNRTGRIIKRDESLQYGWIMYHYPYVFDWQVSKKANYYPNGVELEKLIGKWKNNHNLPLLYGSRTRPFGGKHPEIINEFLEGINE